MPELDHDSADAGIADQNSTPSQLPAAEPKPLDPKPYQDELEAGIADENAVPE